MKKNNTYWWNDAKDVLVVVFLYGQVRAAVGSQTMYIPCMALGAYGREAGCLLARLCYSVVCPWWDNSGILPSEVVGGRGQKSQ